MHKSLELLEIKLDEPDDFLVVKETLTRVGIDRTEDNGGSKTLEQVCHIFHRRGKYYLIHCNELRILNGVKSSLTEEDVLVRNTIAFLLNNWGLCRLLEDVPVFPQEDRTITVVSFKDKQKWRLYTTIQPGRK